MNTDTIYLLNDTLVAKLNLVNSKIPVVIENTANANNTHGWIMAIIICFTVIAVAKIVSNTISKWHQDAININKKDPVVEPSQEEKNKKEYTSRLLSFMEELSKKDSKMKDANEDACKAYAQLLTDLAKKGKME